MRSTCSVYIDAGYLLAAAATRVTGTSLRNGIHVDFASLIGSIIQEAEQSSGLPVLRIHWYDSAKNGVPDARQERIGELSKVKLRLGRFGVDGQQKGVDLRIGLDLVAHARNGAADVFFLLSGDDDLTEAVEEAQMHGVQVVIMAVPTREGRPHGVNRHLVRAADELDLLPAGAIDTAVMQVAVPVQAEPVPVPVARRLTSPSTARGPESAVPTPKDLTTLGRPPAPSRAAVLAYTGATGAPSQVFPGYDDEDRYDEQIDTVAAKVLSAFKHSASPDDVADLLRGKPSIPRDIDRALLTDASEALDMYDLSERIRYRLRARFWEQIEGSS